MEIAWDDDARREIERETIYLRERLRARVEDLVRGAGRSRVTAADLAQARRTPPRMAAGGAAQAPAETAPEPDWPVSFGVYRVLDLHGSVAACTLASEALMDALAARRPAGVAIVGRVYTENFGVEKVVANLVANPRLRVLVLCGTESRHRVGQTLLALRTNGAGADGRVAGSTSPLPLVRNLSAGAVRIYREKLEIVDLRGEDDAEAVLARLTEIGSRARPPWPERWAPEVETVRLAAGQAAMGGRFTPDPAGLFLLGIGPTGKTIHAEHYTREGVMDRRVIGESAAAICQALVQAGLLGDVGHATYVARELQKAELALRLGLAYEQDCDLTAPAR